MQLIYHNFLIIDDSETDIENVFTLLSNKYSILYYTFKIKSEDEIYEKLKDILTYNIKYVHFKVNAPNITIDSDMRDYLCEQYNIVDIKVTYNVLIDEYGEGNLDDVIQDTTNVNDLFETLNIQFDEFYKHNTADDYDKLEILVMLLNMLFEDTDITDENRENTLNIVKKYMLKHDTK
jgi:hypothetical protein